MVLKIIYPTFRAPDKKEYLVIIRDNLSDSASADGSQHMVSLENKKNYPSTS